MKIPENIVVMILGIMTLFKHDNAISFIAIVWGISGLSKGIKEAILTLSNFNILLIEYELISTL